MGKTTVLRPPKHFDYCELILKLGGHEGVAEGLARYNLGNLKPRQVYSWYFRKSIPSQWVPHVLALAMAEGVIEDLLAETMDEERPF